jgi:hypothetical protein
MTDRTVPETPRRRPFGVIVLAILQFSRAVLVARQLLGLNANDQFDWLRSAAQIPDTTPGTVAFTISQGLAVAILVASVAIGLGLLANRRWAWVGAIVISGLSLAFALGAWLDGRPLYLAMAINVVAVFYLNQREVRSVYEDGAPPLEPAAMVLEEDSPTPVGIDGAAP